MITNLKEEALRKLICKELISLYGIKIMDKSFYNTLSNNKNIHPLRIFVAEEIDHTDLLEENEKYTTLMVLDNLIMTYIENHE